MPEIPVINMELDRGVKLQELLDKLKEQLQAQAFVEGNVINKCVKMHIQVNKTCYQGEAPPTKHGSAKKRK